MKNKKRIILLSILVLIVLLVMFSTIKGYIDKSQKNKKDIETYKVKKEDPITLNGKIKPEKTKEYKKEDFGDYYNILVKNGAHVDQGDKIINYNIDNEKRQSLINNIFEKQETVNSSYKSIEEQGNNNHLNTQLSQNLASLNDAENKLASYDNKIYDSTHAAFNGIIDVGGSQKRILKLLSLDSNIEVNINELEIDKVKEGKKVNININKSGKKTIGKIGYISQSPTSSDKAENTNNLSEYKVIIDDINGEIRDGSSVTVTIPSNTLKIPDIFLTKDNNVFVLDKNRSVHKRKVEVKKQGGETIVTKGLKEGETVVYRDKPFNDGEKAEVSK